MQKIIKFLTRVVATIKVLILLTYAVTAQQQKEPIQDHSGSALHDEIFRADSLMFVAFNHCDSETYKNYIAPDLEFYHDLGGLSVGSAIEMQSFREMCQRGSHIRRELVKNTLEVYPIKGYGAVEIGVHRFYHTNPGQPERISGTYKFIHVWHKDGTRWKLARVISYAHDVMNNN